jgi:hypothetical protein
MIQIKRFFMICLITVCVVLKPEVCIVKDTDYDGDGNKIETDMEIENENGEMVKVNGFLIADKCIQSCEGKDERDCYLIRTSQNEEKDQFGIYGSQFDRYIGLKPNHLISLGYHFMVSKKNGEVYPLIEKYEIVEKVTEDGTEGIKMNGEFFQVCDDYTSCQRDFDYESKNFEDKEYALFLKKLGVVDESKSVFPKSCFTLRYNHRYWLPSRTNEEKSNPDYLGICQNTKYLHEWVKKSKTFYQYGYKPFEPKFINEELWQFFDEKEVELRFGIGSEDITKFETGCKSPIQFSDESKTYPVKGYERCYCKGLCKPNDLTDDDWENVKKQLDLEFGIQKIRII